MATMIHRTRNPGRTRHQRLEQLLVQQDTVRRNRKQVLRNGLPTATSGVMDLEEHSLDAEEQRLGFSVLALTSQTVQGIETALRRLAAGEYGTCPDCGGRISDARLKALPFAVLCLACQEKGDRAEVAVDSRAAARWNDRVALTRIGSLGLWTLAPWR